MFSRARHYLLCFLISAITGLVCLGGWNFFVDPNFLFHYSEVSSQNKGFERDFKPWHLRAKKPEVVVIGNSRPLFSFDVDLLPNTNAYNFAIAGATTRELLANFRHAVYAGSVKQVYMNLDNVCSNIAVPPNFHLSSDLYTNVRAHFHRASRLLQTQNLTDFLMGKPLLDDKLYDLQGRRTRFDSNRTPRESFLFRENNKIRNGLKARSSSHCNTSAVKEILRLAHQSGIRLSIFTNPIHMRYIEIDHMFGRSEKILDTRKRILVSVNEQVAKESGEAPFPIYDFLLVNEVTTEEIRFSDYPPSNYWFESSHYRKAIGDMMVLFMLSPEKSLGVDGFAKVISSSNIDQHISEQVSLFNQWRDNSPTVINELSKRAKAIEGVNKLD